jgi:hypothetical protein
MIEHSTDPFHLEHDHMSVVPNQPSAVHIDADQLLKYKPEHPPVLVVGMHNSGTSMLTEILHKSGIFFGANMRHFESFFFTNFINDRVILGGGDSWAKLPILTVERVLSFESSVGPFIQAHWLADYLQWGYDGRSPWGVKDPRLCVLLPLYLKLFPDAKVVHIRRDPNDVAASLTRRYKEGVGRLDDFEHWKDLTLAYTQRVLDYASKCRAYHELSYESFCTDTEVQTRRLFDFLGLPFTGETGKLLSSVSPSRIGSYQEMLDFQEHPMRSRIRSVIVKVLKR